MEHQRKEKWENTRRVISLDDATLFPGASFSQVKVTPFTKENKELAERVVVAAAVVITVTIYQLSCDNLVWFFPLVGMFALRSSFLEVYLYQKEANIICHSPSLLGCSLTAKSPWEANRSSRIPAASPVEAPGLTCICSLSHSLVWLGCSGAVETSPSSCPNLPETLSV